MKDFFYFVAFLLACLSGLAFFLGLGADRIEAAWYFTAAFGCLPAFAAMLFFGYVCEKLSDIVEILSEDELEPGEPGEPHASDDVFLEERT